MKIMALDVGSNRIGVALADDDIRVAVPLQVLEKKDGDNIIQQVIQLIHQHRAEKLIVGFPKKLNGEIGNQAEKVIAFVDELKNNLAIEIVLWDERFTTVEATKRLRGLYKSKRIKQIVDASAAALILQSYIDCVNAGCNDE
ncbi:MAG: hypothetical protein A2Y62_17810 [Candidatus Fischerbacteria bacterium RBG_13_37_8]|uniref:Putative pre-16S rRNA nuclease n=1 Tax=Candidatus Fischerbacteria bacterium RBG_13_37_8 TaxID=1817863 RepID=A0A1F5VP57_9BACT|nr:MAG: hypothetical protein A2Y62_17810 [Candidatus Fischerbacteria bacterium RBG_13_37_8]